MKAWKRTLSAVMSICLVFSLFTGLNFTSTAAGEHGILQNGALSENTNGWAITGLEEVSSDNGVEAGCKLDGDAKHLSIWNNSAAEKTFSMTQTITNMAAGTYTAKVESVGNGATKHNLILKAHNDTSKKEVTVNVNTTDWQNYTASSTAELEVAEGDTVTISISGPLAAKGEGDGEWYGIKNIEFDAATAVEAAINVKKVPGLSKDFIHGVDVSTYLSEIQSGVKYKDETGAEKNMFEIFKNAGVNYVRLRVWNCPFRVNEAGKILYVDDQGNEYNEDQVTTTQHKDGYYEYALKDGGKTVYREGYGAGNCDIDAAVATGKIATEHGMKVLIDFHYSDFWADPAKMKSPKAWEKMTIDQKSKALSDYTTDCLNKLKAGGVDVGMVQVGNEINGGMAGEKDWANVSKLLDAGTKAVRAADPNILIAIHYADPHKENYQVGKAKALADAKIDYDVFASSYYSFWHGSPENLTKVLSEIATTYKKKVMVAEVSYCTTTEDGDGAANVVNKDTSPLNYSIDAQGEGQAAAVRDAIAAVSAVGDAGIGTFYWEPAWVPVGNYAGADAAQKEAVLKSNIDKWEKFGSGWASKWSGPAGGGYDPGVDKDESTHGSQWDNQAMFDFNGKALPSINVYKWVYTGTEGPVRVSTVDTAAYTMNYKDTPNLPATVNVNLNDGNVVKDVAVTWNADQLEALKTAEFGEYTIDGDLAQFTYDSKGITMTVPAGEQKTTCAVTVTGTNVLPNGSFEDGETIWTPTEGAQFKTDGAGGNAKDGNNYYDGWNESALDFGVEQTITEPLASGKYSLFGYYQGTNVDEVSEESGLTATVTYKNGEVKTYTAKIEIPGTWKVFYQAKTSGIIINQNVASVKITSRVACTGKGGPWVVMDDLNLMRADDLTAEEEAFGAASSETEKKFKVTFNVNGGKAIKTKNKTVTAGKKYGTLPKATRAGYTFSGWYTAKTGGKKITASSKVSITKDSTLYAHWQKVAKPGNAKKPTVKNTKKNTIKVTVKKVNGADGYEIRYAVKSNMKGAKKVTVKKTSSTITNKKMLKKGKTSYVQVRAYKTDSTGKKIYSKSYSPKANVKITK